MLKDNNDSSKIELKNNSINTADEITDHCAGLLLIKPCNALAFISYSRAKLDCYDTTFLQ